MNLAKLTAAGQITVPAEIRKMLKLKTGDKILFIQNDRGEVVIDNASIGTLHKAQRDFGDAAEGYGKLDEDVLQSRVAEACHGKGE